jgi:hypothetical protein
MASFHFKLKAFRFTQYFLNNLKFDRTFIKKCSTKNGLKIQSKTAARGALAAK